MRLVLILLMLLSARVWAQTQEVVVRVRSNASTRSSRITLGELSTITPKTKIGRTLAQQLSKLLVVSDLPLDGEEQLGAEEILELIVAGGIELERVGYSIPPTVRVHRLARALDQEELRVAIVNYLSEHKPDLELSSLTLPAGQRTFAGATLTSVGTPEWLGQNRLRIPIKISTVALDAEQQLLVEAKVAKFANVPVARASISRGATIDTEKLVMARVNLADLPLDVVTESRDLVGRTADIPVAAGAYFRSSAVKATPLVRSGSALTVRYQHGSLIATVAAVALQDGAMGELIKVRNNASNRVLEGRVVDSALVEIVK